MSGQQELDVVGMVDARGRSRSRFQTFNDEPSKTIQSDKNKADIQKILQRHQTIGLVDHLNQAEAQFMDVGAYDDFADVMRIAKSAELEFMQLPSKMREIFDHDVTKWLDSAHDEEKRDALIEAGYLEAPEVPEVPETAPVEPVVPAAAGGEEVKV